PPPMIDRDHAVERRLQDRLHSCRAGAVTSPAPEAKPRARTGNHATTYSPSSSRVHPAHAPSTSPSNAPGTCRGPIHLNPTTSSRFVKGARTYVQAQLMGRAAVLVPARAVVDCVGHELA